jgi:hypothetical protein
MSLLQEMQTHGLADCAFNRKLNSVGVIEKSLFWQVQVLNQSHKPEQRERAKKAIIKLLEELKQAREA